jgi:hypothetical protein
LQRMALSKFSTVAQSQEAPFLCRESCLSVAPEYNRWNMQAFDAHVNVDGFEL